MSDIKYIYAFAVMVAFAGALVIAGLPEQFQVITGFDVTILITQMTTIAGTCVATGGGLIGGVIGSIACAGVLTFWTIYNLIDYFLSNEIIRLVLFTPINIVITYIFMKLARGTG